MKTPDEIKKGLEYCMSRYCAGVKCPYFNAESCNAEKIVDTLACIQQLEAEVAELKDNRICQKCKHFDIGWNEPCLHCDGENNCFEWRGVQKEE